MIPFVLNWLSLSNKPDQIYQRCHLWYVMDNVTIASTNLIFDYQISIMRFQCHYHHSLICFLCKLGLDESSLSELVTLLTQNAWFLTWFLMAWTSLQWVPATFYVGTSAIVSVMPFNRLNGSLYSVFTYILLLLFTLTHFISPLFGSNMSCRQASRQSIFITLFYIYCWPL